MIPWHLIWMLAPEQIYEATETSVRGLKEVDARNRQLQYGFNELPDPPPRWLLLGFIDQLNHFMALLLWDAGILSCVYSTPGLG